MYIILINMDIDHLWNWDKIHMLAFSHKNIVTMLRIAK